MMKRSKSISIIMIILFFAVSIFPIKSFASSFNHIDLSEADVILETSNPEIGVAFFISDNPQSYAYQTTKKTGTGYFYKTANGSKIADFDCTGTFSYDGKICNVTDVQTSVWGTISGYRVDVSKSKNQISPTYACATGLFNLYDLGVFGDKLTSSATINIYCNQNGSTSVEFNSDDD